MHTLKIIVGFALLIATLLAICIAIWEYLPGLVFVFAVLAVVFFVCGVVFTSPLFGMLFASCLFLAAMPTLYGSFKQSAENEK